MSELPKKKRLRFRDEDDLALLREVVGLNPFENPQLWVVIQEHIFSATGKKFLIKTLKDHLDLLIQIWLEKAKIFKDRSGIEEEHTEKDSLCQNIHCLMIEFRRKKSEKQKKNKGIEKRDFWANQSYIHFNKENNSSNYLEVEDMCIEVENIPQVEEEETTGSVLPDHMYASIDQANDNNILSKNLLTPTTSGISKKVKSESYTRGKNNIIQRNKNGVRRTSMQKQGLAYQQNFDEHQNEIKKKEFQLEERRQTIGRKQTTIGE
ncbi:unnamed protein product [Diabrotica balteata]|uniref:Uncharacterized protein n=1 Tax=Diabrotica balteata TaxID=107213 RepID=A0A9N9TDH1_DIABA|nr:unnamed protein product [Diabrotica balteata]